MLTVFLIALIRSKVANLNLDFLEADPAYGTLFSLGVHLEEYLVVAQCSADVTQFLGELHAIFSFLVQFAGKRLHKRADLGKVLKKIALHTP
ncbi:MAG: hypothetical protein JSV56_06225 [Methanomassiliicoccales archaeon]|nr:MAG: hypothetical protein JSV56_06225 [Methanomassiliicoccales archaeon]